MSSPNSNLNEPQAPGASSGPPRTAVVMVVVTMALLVALVWALNPAPPKFEPAPLESATPGCAKLRREFVPSNVIEIPGLPLDTLSPEQKNRVLLRLNMEPCPCGCNLSIASCLISNPDCEASKELARKILAEVQAGAGRPAGR